MQDEESKELLKALVGLNAIIAGELLQITENTSAALRGSVPQGCLSAHDKLRGEVLAMLKASGNPALLEHLSAHLGSHS